MRALLAGPLLFLALACGADGEQVASTPAPDRTVCNERFKLSRGIQTINFSSKFGGPRTATVYVPSSLNETTPTSLVLFFHGWTNTCRDFGGGCKDKYCHFPDMAESRGFIFAAMCGVDNSFNAGQCCPPANSEANPVDDVASAKALVRHLTRNACIDKERVYATGYSNGGMLVQRLACEAPDVFSAVASVAGTNALRGADEDQSGLQTCRDKYKAVAARVKANSRDKQVGVSVLDLHGSEDVYVPYNGSAWLGMAGVDETFETLAKLGGCKAKATTMTGDRIRTTRRDDCHGNATLENVLISGQEHAWITDVPGVHATQYVLDFFDRASLAKGHNVSDPSTYAPVNLNPPEEEPELRSAGKKEPMMAGRQFANKDKRAKAGSGKAGSGRATPSKAGKAKADSPSSTKPTGKASSSSKASGSSSKAKAKSAQASGDDLLGIQGVMAELTNLNANAKDWPLDKIEKDLGPAPKQGDDFGLGVATDDGGAADFDLSNFEQPVPGFDKGDMMGELEGLGDIMEELMRAMKGVGGGQGLGVGQAEGLAVEQEDGGVEDMADYE